jgi:uncharacterized protein YecE (DUF72 family)
MPELRVGTSAFTAAGWPGSYYPDGMKPAEYLTFYATRFKTVAKRPLLLSFGHVPVFG